MTQEKNLTVGDLETLADRAMQDFNFEKVRDYMHAVDWRWRGLGDDPDAPPSIDRIQAIARYLLTQAIWDPRPHVQVSTGGLLAIKSDWGMSLHFCLTSASGSR